HRRIDDAGKLAGLFLRHRETLLEDRDHLRGLNLHAAQIVQGHMGIARQAKPGMRLAPRGEEGAHVPQRPEAAHADPHEAPLMVKGEGELVAHQPVALRCGCTAAASSSSQASASATLSKKRALSRPSSARLNWLR